MTEPTVAEQPQRSAVPLCVVVADDEPLAAASLAAELRRLGCSVDAIATGGAAAISACVAHRPDACFTDVAMPGHDGLAVARALRAAAPGMRVVFVSAHPHFAVDAYGADVIDFVLKPVRRDRLAAAVERVRRALGDMDVADRLLVPERGTIHVVPVHDIEWVQADGYSLWLHTAHRAWLLRERMHQMEQPLAASGFLRVHRSALVRGDAIRTLDRTRDAEPSIVLNSGTRVRVARDRVAMLCTWLEQHSE